jgi:hypothetical protein
MSFLRVFGADRTHTQLIFLSRTLVKEELSTQIRLRCTSAKFALSLPGNIYSPEIVTYTVAHL